MAVLLLLTAVTSVLFTITAASAPLVNISTNTGRQDSGPAAYEGEYFNLEIVIQLTDTVPRPVTVQLELPNQVMSSSNCKKHVNGAMYGCSIPTSGYDVFADVSTSTAQFIYGLGIEKSDGSFIPTAVVGSTVNMIDINLGTVSLLSAPGGPLSYQQIKISLNTTLLPGMDNYTFDATVTSGAQPPVSDQVTLKILGPDLTVSVTTSGADIESGVTTTYTLTIHHTSESTETATQILVEISGMYGTTFVNGSGSIQQGSGAAGPLSAASLTFMSITDITLAQNTTIQFQRTANDDIPVGSAISCTVTLSYKNSQGYTVTRQENTHIPTKNIQWTSEPVNPATAPLETLNIGDSVIKNFNFQMPLGTMDTFSIKFDFTSDVLATIPLTFTESRIIAPNYITIDPGLKSITKSGFVPPESRRKRSLDQLTRVKRATSAKSITRPFGTITNPAGSGTSMAAIIVWVTFTVQNPVPAYGGPLSSLVTAIYNGITLTFAYSPTAVTTADLTVTKTVEMIDPSKNQVRFNVTVSHSGFSMDDAHQVVLTDGNPSFMIVFSSLIPSLPRPPGFKIINDDKIIEWTESSLNRTTGQTMFLSYQSIPVDEGNNIPEGINYYNASLLYQSPVGFYKTQQGAVCIDKTEVVNSNFITEHGYTVLMFLVGLLVAAILVVIIFFLLGIFMKRRAARAGVEPTKESGVRAVDAKVQKASKGLLNTTSVKKGAKTIKDFSSSAYSGSIITILSLRDRLQMQREIDSQDIMSTIEIDTDIEKERNSATIQATRLLVISLRNQPLTKGTEEKCLGKFDKDLKDLDKHLDDEYRLELQKILDTLNAKQKEKLVDLLMRQEQEKEDMEEKLKNKTPKEREEIMSLQAEQHETETNEVTYLLKLQRDEEMEKLRKEYAIRKRMGIKEIQQQVIDNVKDEGKLTTEQADWLIKQHIENQARLEKLYDDEISRQRMALEEKLAKRRALAKESEDQEKYHSDMLNTMAEQHFDVVDTMKQNKYLSKSEAKELMRQAQEEMMEAKDRMEAQRKKQEMELHKKLSDRKQSRIKEMKKKQETELAELDKKHQSMQTEGPVDPVSILESRQTLLSHQRAELSHLEDDIDREHAQELEHLREEVAREMQATLQDNKKKLLDRSLDEGLTQKQINKLLSQHEREVQRLTEVRGMQRKQQEEELQAELEKRRKQWSRQKEVEQSEQQQLRDYEDQVVQKMMGTQIAISEEERDRILKEHEKQMVKLENSLTLSKLQQKRMLEDKLAAKRAMRMEQLQKEHLKETKKQERASQDDYADEDQVIKKEMKLLRKQARERLEALQDNEDFNLEGQMEEIKVALMKERADALKEQELHLGAMLASLQMEKAKELARIEEQQKAINNLKANLMDDLHDKGILSDPECKRIIDMHQQEQEKLSKKLQSQRERQEKRFRLMLEKRCRDQAEMLKTSQDNEMQTSLKRRTQGKKKFLQKRLQERLKSREESLLQMQSSQIEDTVSRIGGGTAARLRVAALKHKHMVEMEQFQQRMEKEISQTLEEMRRQHELRRMQVIQEQEMQFLSGLVQLGKFRRSELVSIITILYPHRGEKERQEIMDQLCQGYQFPPEEPEADEVLERRTSTLENRVRRSTLRKVKDPQENLSLSGSLRGRKSGKGKKKNSRQPSLVHREEDYGQDNYMSNPSIGYRQLQDETGAYSQRPYEDPYRDGYYPQDSHNGDMYGRVPPTRLPPVQPKKAKGRKKMVRVADADYGYSD